MKIIRASIHNKNIVWLTLMVICMVLLILLTVLLFVYVVQQPREEEVPAGNVQVTSSEIVSSIVVVPDFSAESSHPETSENTQLDDWRLVLVNSDVPMPDDFEQVIGSFNGIEMDERIIEPYQEMYAAAQQDGVYLWISSGYRDKELQEKLFRQETEIYLAQGYTQPEAEAEAEKSVQRPGYSEHNTGLALDLNGVLEDFQHDEAYLWLQEHAEEYGFVLRYPEGKSDITKIIYEPWHFRYVGPEHAKEMNRLGMCLEEYVEYLKEKMAETD